MVQVEKRFLANFLIILFMLFFKKNEVHYLFQSSKMINLVLILKDFLRYHKQHILQKFTSVNYVIVNYVFSVECDLVYGLFFLSEILYFFTCISEIKIIIINNKNEESKKMPMP